MYVTSREFKFIKYVANFHTKSAADEFEAHLKNLLDNDIEKKLIGIKRFRNSVIFSMEDNSRGYILAKEFEEAYINKNKPQVTAPAPQPEPEPIVIPEPQPLSKMEETEEPTNDEMIIEEYIKNEPEPVVEQTYLSSEEIDEIKEEPPTIEERMGTNKIVNLFKFNK